VDVTPVKRQERRVPSDFELSAMWTDLPGPEQKGLLIYCAATCDKRGHVMLDIQEAAASLSLDVVEALCALHELLRLNLLEPYEQGVSIDGRVWGYRLSLQRMRELARPLLPTPYSDGYEEVAP
jgi:hypothetical protein